MPDEVLRLSRKDHADALSFAGSQSWRPAHLLEKDIWVVRTLERL